MPAQRPARVARKCHRQRTRSPFRVLLALAGLLPACIAQEPPAAGVPVALTLEPEFISGRLTVTGTTDLPDGAILLYEARHENWRAAGEPVWLRASQVVVEQGAYRDRIDVRRWPAGSVEIWVSFQAVLPDGEQPQAVLERFGPMGERLAGENVSQEGPMKRVAMTVTVEPERR